MKIELAKCCATCIRYETVAIAQKKKDKIYTGISSDGKCYDGKYPKSCSPHNVCKNHKFRDDIYSQEELSTN